MLCAKFPGYFLGQPFEGIAHCSSLLNLIQFLALKFLNTYNLCTLAELHLVLLLLIFT